MGRAASGVSLVVRASSDKFAKVVVLAGDDGEQYHLAVGGRSLQRAPRHAFEGGLHELGAPDHHREADTASAAIGPSHDPERMGGRRPEGHLSEVR